MGICLCMGMGFFSGVFIIEGLPDVPDFCRTKNKLVEKQQLTNKS